MEVDRIEISFEEEDGVRYVRFYVKFSAGGELRDRKRYDGNKITLKFVEEIPEPKEERTIN